MTKSTLQVPDGYEFSHVDEQGVIHLKEKEVVFPKRSIDVLGERYGYFITNSSKIESVIEPSLTDNNKNVVLSLEIAEAFLAMMQLVTLCDAWNEIDKFVPDWTNDTSKYAIEMRGNEIKVEEFQSFNSPIRFKTYDRALQFLNAFPELLEKAKRLL